MEWDVPARFTRTKMEESWGKMKDETVSDTPELDPRLELFRLWKSIVTKDKYHWTPELLAPYMTLVLLGIHQSTSTGEYHETLKNVPSIEFHTHHALALADCVTDDKSNLNMTRWVELVRKLIHFRMSLYSVIRPGTVFESHWIGPVDCPYAMTQNTHFVCNACLKKKRPLFEEREAFRRQRILLLHQLTEGARSLVVRIRAFLSIQNPFIGFVELLELTDYWDPNLESEYEYTLQSKCIRPRMEQLRMAENSTAYAINGMWKPEWTGFEAWSTKSIAVYPCVQVKHEHDLDKPMITSVSAEFKHDTMSQSKWTRFSSWVQTKWNGPSSSSESLVSDDDKNTRLESDPVQAHTQLNSHGLTGTHRVPTMTTKNREWKSRIPWTWALLLIRQYETIHWIQYQFYVEALSMLEDETAPLPELKAHFVRSAVHELYHLLQLLARATFTHTRTASKTDSTQVMWVCQSNCLTHTVLWYGEESKGRVHVSPAIPWFDLDRAWSEWCTLIKNLGTSFSSGSAQGTGQQCEVDWVRQIQEQCRHVNLP